MSTLLIKALSTSLKPAVIAYFYISQPNTAKSA